LKNISKHCHFLYDKTEQTKERITNEMKSIRIIKKKTEENKKDIDQNRNEIDEKLNRLKQCLPSQQQMKSISKKRLRRLSVLTDQTRKSCEKKLSKVERIFLSIARCHRLEFDDEKLLSLNRTIDSNSILSPIYYLENCRLDFDFYFDELAFFWKRYVHLQLDLSIRMKEKQSHLKYAQFFKEQLRNLI
jgi:hypothetical protein